VIDIATVSPQLARERIIHWDDPGALAEAGQTMSGEISSTPCFETSFRRRQSAI
jgi:hypothetical protein